MYIGDADIILEKTIATTRGEDITLYHRDPTPDEIHAYNNEAIRRKGNKVEFRQSYAQEKYGLRILTGIKEGDFGIIGPDKKPVCVSSDPDSDFYRKNWKKLFRQHALSVVITFGAAIFGGTEAVDGTGDIAEDDDEEDQGEDISQD
jgi:hypothetical protein